MTFRLATQCVALVTLRSGYGFLPTMGIQLAPLAQIKSMSCNLTNPWLGLDGSLVSSSNLAWAKSVLRSVGLMVSVMVVGSVSVIDVTAVIQDACVGHVMTSVWAMVAGALSPAITACAPSRSVSTVPLLVTSPRKKSPWSASAAAALATEVTCAVKVLPG